MAVRARLARRWTLRAFLVAIGVRLVGELLAARYRHNVRQDIGRLGERFKANIERQREWGEQVDAYRRSKGTRRDPYPPTSEAELIRAGIGGPPPPVW